MTTMNPAIKAKWVAALRSGEYQQGVGVLRTNPTDDTASCYCCLGVLAGLYVQSLGIEWDHRLLEAEDAALPRSNVCEWAGMERDEIGYRRDPKVAINGVTKKLSEHNDCGRTFAEIADAIESQL